MMIPFNKPYVGSNEQSYISQVLAARKLSGDGEFTKKCHEWFEKRYGFKKALLTTSCTAALEMCAILLDIKPGDEVILPSYTFVSTANAFALRGATLKFADSLPDHPNIDPEQIASLISSRTRAIVVVHYAGTACDMDRILSLAAQFNIPVVEDAAQAIEATYKGRPLGSFGALASFSFHETKNISCGEGGLLAINDKALIARAEIIREKGTNRSSFFRGEVDKYGWVDIGSSYLPSDILAGFLFAQLENIEYIQGQRQRVWQRYWKNFTNAKLQEYAQLPNFSPHATNNAHMFYMVCPDLDTRSAVISSLKSQNILAVFHYLSLHASPFFTGQHDGRVLANSDRYTDCLVRLPLFPELSDLEVDRISGIVIENFKQS